MNLSPGGRAGAPRPEPQDNRAPGRRKVVVDEDGAEFLKMFQRFAATAHHAGQGIVGHHHGQAGFLLEQAVQVAQQRAAAGQGDALVGDVGAQLGRRLFQGDLHGGHDLVQRIGQRFRISLDETVKLRGTPSARLRPLTSISRTSEPGKAEPISFLMSSAVGSPISMP